MLDYNQTLSELSDPSGDHVTYANVLAEMEDRQWHAQNCRERFLNYTAVRRALEIPHQLARFLRSFGEVQAMGVMMDNSSDDTTRSKAIRRCVTAGFFFNIAKLDHDGRYYTLRKHMDNYMMLVYEAIVV